MVKVELTDEELSVIVFALTVVPKVAMSFIQPKPYESTHDKWVRDTGYSAFQKLIGRHPDQLAIAGDYSI